MNRFGTPHAIFEANTNTKIIYSRSGTPKRIAPLIKDKHSIAELKGFNLGFVSLNKKFLLDSVPLDASKSYRETKHKK